MQPSSLRSLRLCGESKVARGRCGACVRYAGTTRWGGPPPGRHRGAPPGPPTPHGFLPWLVPVGGRPSGWCQRTARKRRVSPKRPSIHRRDAENAENAEKRRHPPWPLCTLCVSAVKSNASPASGLLQAKGCGRRRSPLAGDPAGGASVPHASAAPPPSDLRFTAETQRTQRRGGTHHDPSAHSASPQ
jgi:hypothetical protein